jgi:hypothetical protein
VRIETVPLILGLLVALLGIGIIFDAWTPDAASIAHERRRRARIDRHRNGEALIGFGVLALAGAFIGRDSWRYSVLVVIIGAAFLVVGAALNARYVRELFVNRGPLRRRDLAAAADPDAMPNDAPVASPGRDDRELPLTRGAEPAGREDFWDGVERRKTPRASGKRRPDERKEEKG